MIIGSLELENPKAMEPVDTRDEEAPLVAIVEAPKNHHTRDVYVLSFAFLFVFLAYGAAQNLESTVNTVRLSSLSLSLLIISIF